MTPTLAQSIAGLKVRLGLAVTVQSRGRILSALWGWMPQCSAQLTALGKKISLLEGLNRLSPYALQRCSLRLLAVIDKIQAVPGGQPSGIFAAVSDQPIPVRGRCV